MLTEGIASVGGGVLAELPPHPAAVMARMERKTKKTSLGQRVVDFTVGSSLENCYERLEAATLARVGSGSGARDVRGCGRRGALSRISGRPIEAFTAGTTFRA
jgi:hypothetical protein